MSYCVGARGRWGGLGVDAVDQLAGERELPGALGKAGCRLRPSETARVERNGDEAEKDASHHTAPPY